eukprot:CAMPEP_0175846100 /NCGR_PEP_ID=MMETSP0107_2-20121207/22597_1 /TAXON_ID=195067 ORGANISM="Goniomonas pacifica, Strain CCMP1869" /NCGR_SAMPLE_ID=MMETSP0107_2 /ASSEMBLY_ACC=CAM_ASM_000203 /LENGTH=116 /DNA_ID=CAMNT_0017160741 /DNA_START=74 /DNA_END=420 /DNA_ORIENTATION=+
MALAVVAATAVAAAFLVVGFSQDREAELLSDGTRLGPDSNVFDTLDTATYEWKDENGESNRENVYDYLDTDTYEWKDENGEANKENVYDYLDTDTYEWKDENGEANKENVYDYLDT